MTVIVTGGAGYIGSHMVLALLDAGENVVVLDNLCTGWRDLVPPEAVFVEGDTGDEELVRDLVKRHGVDAILHFAASIYVPKSMTDPIGYYRNNTVNTHALIAAAAASGVKHFIFSSTAAVYGVPEAVPIPEDAPLNPLSPYGASKMMAERILADVCKAHDLKSCVLRYFNVAGADPKMRAGEFNPASTHLIKVACRTAEGLRDCLDICGNDYATPDGTGVRDYVHVWDLVQAHLAALTYLRSGGASEVFNCGYEHGFSVLEVIEAVKRVSGVDFPVRYSPRRPGDPAELVAGSRRMRDILGWKPAYDNLDEIVRHALTWEKQLRKRRELPVKA